MHLVIRATYTRVAVIMALIITLVLVDTLLFRISLFHREQSVMTSMFIIVSIIISLGQLAILLFVRKRSKVRAIDHRLRLIQWLVPIVQYALVAIVVAVILQLILITYYNTILLILAVAISYATSLVMIGLLAQKFVSWFKSNRRWIVLLYGISFSILFVDIGVTLSLTINLLLDAPTQIWPHYGIVAAQITRGSLTETLTQAYVIFSIMSFAAMWLTTALLLYSYSLRLGRLRYWLFVCSPLVFFLSQFVAVLFNLFGPLIRSDPVFYSIFFTILFSLTKPVGGILFGIAFWTIARKISNRPVIRDRILISALGFVLLFISSQANALFSNPYPPFGLATVPFVSLSSFLLLIGIYSSAIMLSEDARLRKDIRKSILNDSRLLESISKSQLEQEMQNKVTAVTKKHRVEDIVKEEDATESLLDVKDYLDEVMHELLTKREKIKKEDEGLT